MRSITEKLYNYLVKNDGFYMDQYKSRISDRDNWIALKRFEQGLVCVLITNAKDEHENVYLVLEYLKLKDIKFDLKVIVLSDGPYSLNTDDGIHKTVIDIRNNVILHADYETQGLGNIAIFLNEKKEKIKYGHSKLTVTNILIAINVLMFIISVFLSSKLSSYTLIDNAINVDGRALLLLGAKYGPLISNGQVWRLITCAFLHGGILHLACNMYSLYVVGPQVESIYGKVKFIIIYFLSAIGSSLFSFYFSPKTLSIGASGAIFGIFAALLVFVVKNRNRLNKGALNNLIAVLALNLFIGLSSSTIDNFGHLGGLAIGIIVSIICSSI